MKKIVAAAFASAAALALAACGSSDKASEEATAEDVEMPAEEGMPADPAATPVADASATASDAPAADASAAASGAASAAPAADASAAAPADAAKKM